jgi:hypothetical protein
MPKERKTEDGGDRRGRERLCYQAYRLQVAGFCAAHRALAELRFTSWSGINGFSAVHDRRFEPAVNNELCVRDVCAR